jgi:NAD(P)-dependent dehydrogenase (short-subunit alcohol dehydrogenase family)
MNFIDSVVLITGGGSGIGRATALAFARQGAQLVIGNRNSERGNETVRLACAAGGRAIFQPTDVTNAASVRSLIDRAIHEFGRLDIAFNNAGMFGPVALLADQREEDLLQVLDVNVRGMFLCMRAELDVMLAQGYGTIINNASSTGLRNNTHGVALYAAAKSAVISLTRSAAMEYAAMGIRVNAVAPGRVHTEMLAIAAGGDPQRFASIIPMGRLGSPDEVADAVLWLASKKATFVTGQVIAIDGGFLAS